MTLDKSSPNPEPYLAFLLLNAIVGLSLCVFMIHFLSVTGAKRKKVSTFDKILMALSAANVFFIFTMSSNVFIFFLRTQLYFIPSVMYVIFYMIMYSITSTSWLTSTLCFFYFLKILPSQPRVLIKMKAMTSPIIGGLLLASEVVSLGGSFLSILIPSPNLLPINSTESQIEHLEALMTGKVTLMYIVVALNGLPFFIMIVTTLASALLLKHYNSQMKKNIGNVNAKVKDYRTAVHTMTALLMFYLLILLVIIMVSLDFMSEQTWGNWMCEMMLFSFPTVQSALLIYGNPKLKDALRKIFTFTTSIMDSRQ